MQRKLNVLVLFSYGWMAGNVPGHVLKKSLKRMKWNCGGWGKGGGAKAAVEAAEWRK